MWRDFMKRVLKQWRGAIQAMVENVETQNCMSKSSSSQQSSFTLSIKEICNAGLNRSSPNRIKSLFLDCKIILPFWIGLWFCQVFIIFVRCSQRRVLYCCIGQNSWCLLSLWLLNCQKNSVFLTRLIIYAEGQWQLNSPILEHQKIADGWLSCLVDSTEPVNLTQKWLSGTRLAERPRWHSQKHAHLKWHLLELKKLQNVACPWQ